MKFREVKQFDRLGRKNVSNCNLKINLAVLKKMICGKYAENA